MTDLRVTMEAICNAASKPRGLSFGIGPGCAFEAAAAGSVDYGIDGQEANSRHGMHGGLSL